MQRREFMTMGLAAAVPVCFAAVVPEVDPKTLSVPAFEAAVKTLEATTLFDDAARKEALATIQRHIYAMRTAKAFGEYMRGGEKMAPAKLKALLDANPPLWWMERSFEKVFKEFQETKVTGDTPAVWYLYNMGVVVKTKTVSFGIDICHRLAPRLAPLLDFALITHNHGDHFTHPFLQAMAKCGKKVITNFILTPGSYCRGTSRVFTFKDVTVRGNDGDHNKGLPDGVTWWEVACGKEPNAFVICHSGDCCRHDQFHPVAKHPDIFFGHCAVGLSFPKAYQTTMPAKFMVPLHHQELGHLGGRYRCVGFHEEPARIVRELRALGAKVAMPVWGDRIV